MDLKYYFPIIWSVDYISSKKSPKKYQISKNFRSQHPIPSKYKCDGKNNGSNTFVLKIFWSKKDLDSKNLVFSDVIL